MVVLGVEQLDDARLYQCAYMDVVSFHMDLEGNCREGTIIGTSTDAITRVIDWEQPAVLHGDTCRPIFLTWLDKHVGWAYVTCSANKLAVFLDPHEALPLLNNVSAYYDSKLDIIKLYTKGQ